MTGTLSRGYLGLYVQAARGTLGLLLILLMRRRALVRPVTEVVVIMDQIAVGRRATHATMLRLLVRDLGLAQSTC